jgi:hypothetical protein
MFQTNSWNQLNWVNIEEKNHITCVCSNYILEEPLYQCKLNNTTITRELCGLHVFHITPTIFQLYCRGRDRIVVRFTNTYASSAHHHWCCEFESRPLRGVQHYVDVNDLRQVGGFIPVPRFPPTINWPQRYNWNIVESGVKHHQTNKLYHGGQFNATLLLYRVHIPSGVGRS